MNEHNVHFWRASLSSYQLLDTFDYRTAPVYVSAYPSFANVVHCIPNVSFSKIVFDTEKPVASSGRRPMPRAEWNNIAVVRYIHCMFSRPDGLDLDPCLKTRVVTKTSL